MARYLKPWKVGTYRSRLLGRDLPIMLDRNDATFFTEWPDDDAETPRRHDDASYRGLLDKLKEHEDAAFEEGAHDWSPQPVIDVALDRKNLSFGWIVRTIQGRAGFVRGSRETMNDPPDPSRLAGLVKDLDRMLPYGMRRDVLDYDALELPIIVTLDHALKGRVSRILFPYDAARAAALSSASTMCQNVERAASAATSAAWKAACVLAFQKLESAHTDGRRLDDALSELEHVATACQGVLSVHEQTIKVVP